MSKDKEMGLIEHLDELRGRIIVSLLAVTAIAIVAYIFKDWLLSLLTIPIAQYFKLSPQEVSDTIQALLKTLRDSGNFTDQNLAVIEQLFHRQFNQLLGLTFIHPTEAFMSFIKLSFYTGLMVGSPIVLFEIWRFIMPALYDNERRYFLGAFTIGSALFYVGVVFAFVMVFPLVIRFLINMGSQSLTATLTISNYISFSMLFLLVFGVVFELPVLIFLAVRTGLTSVEFLRQKRRYLYVIAFVAAALITPPDVISQLALAIPIVVLFEVSLWLSRWAEIKREKAQAAAGGQLDNNTGNAEQAETADAAPPKA